MSIRPERLLLLALWVSAGPLSSQTPTHGESGTAPKALTHVSSTLIEQKLDPSRVKWDARLDDKNPKQVVIVVDLSDLSPLEAVVSLTITVNVSDGARVVRSEDFDFLKDLGAPLLGGKKYSRRFDLDNGKNPPLKNATALKIVPKGFIGTVHTDLQANYPDLEKRLDKILHDGIGAREPA
jgi:hypothetical protein